VAHIFEWLSFWLGRRLVAGSVTLNIESGPPCLRAPLIRIYRSSNSFGMVVAMKNNLRRHSFIRSTLSKPTACVLGSFFSRFP
jgi:hypothetical protein